jgi:DNA polymerase-3 subunit epsilon
MPDITLRRSAIESARQMIARRPVYLDTETTGLDSEAEIVEISLIDADGTVVLDTLVKPRLPIPAGATEVHGITNAMVADAPSWKAVWPRLAELISNRPVAIYNAEFDLKMMRQSHRANGMRWDGRGAKFYCVMETYAQFYGKWNAYYGSYRWQKLEEAGRQCQIAMPNSHRALADAALAREVLLHIASRVE